MKVSRGTMYKRGKTWYGQFSINQKQVHRSLQTRNPKLAKERFEQMRGEFTDGEAPPPNVGDRPWYIDGAAWHSWSAVVEEALNSCNSWLRMLYQRTKDRANRKSIDFELDLTDMHIIADRTGGFCPVSGVRFSWERPNGCNIPPFAPSLDRINPKEGYRAYNCRLVSHIANLAMSDWGEEVMQEFVRSAHKNNPGTGMEGV